MIKTPREKLLAAVATIAVAIAAGLESGVELPVHPFADLDLALSDAASQAEQHELEVNRLLHDLDALSIAGEYSLPQDPGRASALYQAWLVEQLALSGIESPAVSPAPALPDEFLGHRLTFAIECDASANQLAQFIDRFSNTPLLHRITSLQIVNTSNGFSDLHRLAVSIEALALPNAPERTQLPDPSPTQTAAPSLATLLETNPLLALPEPPAPDPPPANTSVVQGNAETVPAQQANPNPDPEISSPPTPPPTPPKPKYSPGQSLQFVGSILSGGTRQAWFIDRRSGDEFFAPASGEVTIPDLTVKVLSVDDDNVVVLYKSKRVRLKLGQTAALPPTPLRTPQT
ncbi:MAG: hypothetical protein RL215_2898 [Planctomycetota bacterium]|jgi:hypothetical protein